jgi:1,4-alpha-glucan branching enzyme
MLFMGTEGHLDGSWNPVVGFWGDLRFDWSKVGDATGAPMQQMVRDTNNLRWAHDALRTANGFVTHNDTQNQVTAFKRYNANGDVLLVVVNAGNGVWSGNQYGVSLAGDDGTWLEIFNSQAPAYGGINTVGNYQMHLAAANGQIWINLPCWGVLIFARQ